jgi:hypothetical protein
MIERALLFLSLVVQHNSLFHARVMSRMVPCIDLTSELGQCGICWSELTVDHDSLVSVFLFDRCQCVSCHPRTEWTNSNHLRWYVADASSSASLCRDFIALTKTIPTEDFKECFAYIICVVRSASKHTKRSDAGFSAVCKLSYLPPLPTLM